MQNLTVKDRSRHNYTLVNVTDAAWVQIVVSLAADIVAMNVFDSSGQDMILGYGPAGSEVTKLQIPPGGFDSPQDCVLPAGMRLAIKAVSGTASVGINLINFLG
jgi:hypothetical protein